MAEERAPTEIRPDVALKMAFAQFADGSIVQ